MFTSALELIYEHARGGAHVVVSAPPQAIASVVARLNRRDASGPLSDGRPLGYTGKSKYVTQGWSTRFLDPDRSYQRVDIEDTTYFLKFTVGTLAGGKGKLVEVIPYSARRRGARIVPDAPISTEPHLTQRTVRIDSDLPTIDRFDPSAPDVAAATDEVRSRFRDALPTLPADFLLRLWPLVERELTLAKAARAVGSTLAVFLIALLLLFALPLHDAQAQVIEWVRRVLRLDVPGLFSEGAVFDPATMDRLEEIGMTPGSSPPDAVHLRDPQTGEFVSMTEAALSMKLRPENGAILMKSLQGMMAGEMVTIADGTKIPSNISLVKHPHGAPLTLLLFTPEQPKTTERRLSELPDWSATVEWWHGRTEEVPARLIQAEVGNRRANVIAFMTGVEAALPSGSYEVRVFMKGPNYRETAAAKFEVGPNLARRTVFRHNEMFGAPEQFQPGPDITIASLDTSPRPENQLIMSAHSDMDVAFVVTRKASRLVFSDGGLSSGLSFQLAAMPGREWSIVRRRFLSPGRFQIAVEVNPGEPTELLNASIVVERGKKPVLMCSCAVAELGRWVVADLTTTTGHTHGQDNHLIEE